MTNHDARPLRFGILGAAAIAPNALVKPARLVDGVEVAAIAARDRGRAEAFAAKHGVPTVHDSYDALLADPGVDAVYNPLPNGLHGAWTIKALDAGKHVLCEKPFTANADEAAEVAAHAERSGLVVMEAFHWRYHPQTTRLLEVLAAGEVGEVTHVRAGLCFPLLKTADIRFDPALAGGAAMDAGCYAVNMVRTVVGEEPEVVRAEARLAGSGVDRAMEGELRFPGGASGEVRASLRSKRILELSLRITGTQGSIRVFNAIAPQLFGRMTIRTTAGKRVERAARTHSYEHQLRAFLAAVRDGAPFPSTADDAVRNMAVIDALYRAAGLEPRHPTPV